MYTQSFNVPDADAKAGNPVKSVPHDTTLQAHFDAVVDADGKILVLQADPTAEPVY